MLLRITPQMFLNMAKHNIASRILLGMVLCFEAATALTITPTGPKIPNAPLVKKVHDASYFTVSISEDVNSTLNKLVPNIALLVSKY